MKRYLAFTFDRDAARGGWDDYVGAADSVREAIEIAAKAIKHANDIIEIVDTLTLRRVHFDDAASIDAEAGSENEGESNGNR